MKSLSLKGYSPKHTQFILKALASITLFLSMCFSLKAADVRVYTFDSQGAPILGTFKIQKGPNFIGTYNSGDTANLSAGDTYKIWAIYENTSTERVMLTVSPSGDSLAFNTTNVKFHFSGGYLDYRGSGSWKSFGPKVNGEWPDRELFPFDFYGDTMKIHTGYKWNDVRGANFDIYYKGLTSIEKTISILRVLDSEGNPTTGATARGGYTSPTLWHVSGSTDANGLLIDLRNGKQTNLSYEAKVNNTTAIEGPKNPTLDSYYLFQTDKLVLNFQTCDELGISGATVRYGNGNNYSTWWFPNGPTDANGKIVGQVFPGTYSFEMQYKATSDRKIAVVIPSGGDSLIWNSVNVHLTSGGSISYGGASGVSTWFTKPSMELLPGTYKFKFHASGAVLDLALNGCNYTKSEVIVDVLDCNGNNQAGVDVQWYKYGNAGNKHVAGTTGSSSFPVLIDSGVTQVGIVVNYLGETNTLVQNINSNNTFTFQMIDVAVELYNHDSTLTLSPQDVKFYVYGNAGNKMQFPASLHKCLLPGVYGFVVKYNETSQNKNGINVSSQNPVVFQTGLVDDIEACTYSPTTYYQYGQAGNTFAYNDPMEFMPSQVIIKSSANPNKAIHVLPGTIHLLDTCSTVTLIDSCVSDSSWLQSNVLTKSNNSGYWGGVSSLPSIYTFTDSAQVGYPKSYGGMKLVQGSLPIKSSNHITYFLKNFGLTDTVGLEARFRMYMDDGVEIYINGVLIAREENMDWNNFNGVSHDLKIYANGSHDNGYAGGDKFDYISSIDLETILHTGMNSIMIVLRNPAGASNNGGFSFRMDISKNGKSVIVKKKTEVVAPVKKVANPLSVYPNPVSNTLFVNLGDIQTGIAGHVNVFNLNGQLMLHKDITATESTVELDLSNLNTGFYFVRYTSGDVVTNTKIIKH